MLNNQYAFLAINTRFDANNFYVFVANNEEQEIQQSNIKQLVVFN